MIFALYLWENNIFLYSMQLKIPVSRVNRQFVEWKENLAQLPNRVLSHRTYLGMLLNLLLTDEATYLDSNLVGILDDYVDTLTVEVSLEAVTEGRQYLPDSSIIYFNLMLHRFMHEILLDRILDRDALGINQTETIFDFIEDLNLDVSAETLRKSQYRMRQEKKIGSLRLARKQIRYKKKLRKRIVNPMMNDE